MRLLKLIQCAVILVSASPSVCAAAEYELIFEKGAVDPAFRACVNDNYEERPYPSARQDTTTFFSKIYNATYKTTVFARIDRFWHAEIMYEDTSPLIVTVAVLRDVKGVSPDPGGHHLSSKVPMISLSEVRGNRVLHGQVESRGLTDSDRANFKKIVDCVQ